MEHFAITPGTGDDVDGTTDSVTIPDNAAGDRARRVLVTVSEDTYVLPGAAGVTVTATTGIIVTPESGGKVLDVGGYVAIAYLQVSGAGRICVTPVATGP